MSFQKLLTIGDSFTYGDELDDRNHGFPHLLGDRLKMGVINRGVCGSGNIKIVRSLVEENLNDYALVVIAWSGFDRIELADDYGTWETLPGGNKNNYRIPDPSVKFRETMIDYVNRYHADEYLYRQQYLVQVILAQTYLKYHKKRYVMLDAFLNHKFSGRFDSKNKDLLDKIDTTHFLGWPNESMQEWTDGLPTGSKKHFLNEGHRVVAEKIYKHVLTTA